MVGYKTEQAGIQNLGRSCWGEERGVMKGGISMDLSSFSITGKL